MILWGSLKFFDGEVWVVDFCGGGAERVDFSRDLGSGEGERYEQMTVRRNVKNSLIVKVYYIAKKSLQYLECCTTIYCINNERRILWIGSGLIQS